MNAILGTRGQKPTMQVLTLSLHGETYALEAHHVREILDVVPVTDVPGAPVELDPCLKLGMKSSPRSIDTRFIVVEVPVGGVPTIVGVRADRVYEMTELAADALEDAPQIGMRVNSSFVRCIGKRAGEFLVVLDLEAILRADSALGAYGTRRRRRRLHVSIPCRIEIGSQSAAARIADLSEDGASVWGYPSAPEQDRGRIEIEGLAEGLAFRVAGFSNGTLRMAFEPGGHPALVDLVRRLEEEMDCAA